LLTNTVCQATAIAKEPTVVVRIPRNLFRKMLEGYPAAAEKLRDSMTERLQAWSKELASVKIALERDEKS
jgi:CRP-like cAMP-binding protein